MASRALGSDCRRSLLEVSKAVADEWHFRFSARVLAMALSKGVEVRWSPVFDNRVRPLTRAARYHAPVGWKWTVWRRHTFRPMEPRSFHEAVPLDDGYEVRVLQMVHACANPHLGQQGSDVDSADAWGVGHGGIFGTGADRRLAGGVGPQV